MRKRRIVVLVMALFMLVMSAAPALAAAGGTDRPRPGIPANPPGQDFNDHEQRPAHAADPVTGPVRDI